MTVPSMTVPQTTVPISPLDPPHDVPAFDASLLDAYRHSIDYLYGLMTLEPERRLPKRFPGAGEQAAVDRETGAVGLLRCQRLLDFLGNPERKLQYVHVTGTSGKGSTVALLQSILVEAGVRVGVHGSPHITTPLERIQLGDRLIPLPAWLKGISRLKPFIEQEYRSGPYGVPSFQEVLFGLALQAFVETGVELALIEVGIGGRLDSTNLITAPLLALVTEVGLDHTELLGPDIPSIAREKAGIFKARAETGAMALTSTRSVEARAVLEAAASGVRIPLWRLGEELEVRGTAGDFTVSSPLGRIEHLRTGLPGEHQPLNALLAVTAAQALASRGFPVTEEGIRRGLERTFLPGRCEAVTLEKGGVLVLDMAHNRDKILGLARFWRERLGLGDGERAGSVVVALSHDKDVGGILEVLGGVFERLHVTRPLAVPRLMFGPMTLGEWAGRLGLEVSVHLDPWDALREAMVTGGGRVVVTGSAYLVGEVRSRLCPVETVLRDGKMRPLTGEALRGAGLIQE